MIMDFVNGLPRINNLHDSLWIIVDCLTNYAHLHEIQKGDVVDN